MDIYEAAEILQIKESALDKLLTEKDKLSQKVEWLRMTRSMALRGMAAGDKSMYKEINDLEDQIAPLRFKLEELLILVAEANEDVQAAKISLDQAKEEQRRTQTLYESQ